MSAGRILTLGYGNPFAGRRYVPTLGYGTAAAALDQVGATPGFIRSVYEYYKRKRDDEPDRRPPETPEEAVREYAERSEVLVKAVSKIRAESDQLREEIAGLRERMERASSRRTLADLDHKLMLQEQRATLAAAEERALLEEMELNDVMGVALIALAYVMQ